MGRVRVFDLRARTTAFHQPDVHLEWSTSSAAADVCARPPNGPSWWWTSVGICGGIESEMVAGLDRNCWRFWSGIRILDSLSFCPKQLADDIWPGIVSARIHYRRTNPRGSTIYLMFPKFATLRTVPRARNQAKTRMNPHGSQTPHSSQREFGRFWSVYG